MEWYFSCRCAGSVCPLTYAALQKLVVWHNRRQREQHSACCNTNQRPVGYLEEMSKSTDGRPPRSCAGTARTRICSHLISHSSLEAPLPRSRRCNFCISLWGRGLVASAITFPYQPFERYRRGIVKGLAGDDGRCDRPHDRRSSRL